MKNLFLVIILSILTQTSNAEQATSGNLLPNAGVGTTSVQNQSGSIDGINGSNGWTTSGISNFNNELEAQGTGTISANGSLLNITTEKENGGQFTTTTNSLDGGVRLDSTTEVQSCEWIGSAHQCGQATNGRDSYSTTVNIKDENNQVLSSVTQNRNNDAGYYGNTFIYNDTVIHNGTGARNWDWTWTGVDGNNVNATGAVGPNLLGAELTATLLDIDYSPIPPAVQTELVSFNNEIREEFKKLEEVINLKEEVKLEKVASIQEEPKLTEPKMEKFKEPVKTMPVKKEEEPKQFVTQNKQITSQSSSPAQTKTLKQETSKEEKMVKEIAKEEKTEKTKQVSNKSSSNSNVSSEDKPSVSVVLQKTMDKIDERVKDIGKNLKIKNLFKMRAMVDNSLLDVYNIPFYETKNIYKDQPSIQDNRRIYTTSLESYQRSDPIFQMQRNVQKMRLQRERLKREIEVLKNG